MNTVIELFKNWTLYPVMLVLWCLGWWILDRVFPAFLKNYYDTRLELSRRDQLRRDKTAVISELLVLLRSKNTTDEYKDKIDKNYLDLALHLPPCLVHKLAWTVCKPGDPNSLSPLALFLQIRSFIDGTYTPDKTAKLEEANIPFTKR